MAAVLYILASLVALLLLALPDRPAMSQLGLVVVMAVSIVAMLVGVIVWFLPWQRWPRSVSLWLVPPAFALIAVSNVFKDDPYNFGTYFVLAFTWIGVAHRRGTALRCVPGFAVAYLVPLLVAGRHAPTAIYSLINTGAICVLVGETLAWLSTRLRAAQAELHRRQSEARFRSLVQHASDVITITAADGTIHYQTPSGERIFGHGPADLVGTSLTALVHADDVPRVLAFLDEAAAQPGAARMAEWRWRHRDGSWRQVETIATNLLDDPTVGGLVLTSRDISERKALEEQLTHQAFHDPLTGLANRALFEQHLRQALLRVSQPSHSLAVVFLDLDNFKMINDSLGHAAGDAVLLTVAERLRTCVRTGDTLARFGGDEFAILLEDLQDRGDAAEVAERIITALSAPVLVHGTEVVTGTSIGIAAGTAGQAEADTLLRNADIAMYMAKRHGKGRALVFEPSMQVQVTDRLMLEADLRHALERQELCLHYQPIVNLESGAVTGVEALLRWRHPQWGPVAPTEFIPVAEEAGLIIPIGEWVLAEACRQVRAWHRQYPSHRPLVVSVNVSARQLEQDSLVEAVAAGLRASGLDPRCLILEIRESVLLEQSAAALGSLRRLKDLGVELALDDFGAGYSSLSCLHSFPVDILKLNKAFIDRLGNGAAETAVTGAVIQLAHTLNLHVVAEGIEAPAQVSELRALACDEGQGYYFARPLDPHRLGVVLGQDRPAPGELVDSPHLSAVVSQLAAAD